MFRETVFLTMNSEGLCIIFGDFSKFQPVMIFVDVYDCISKSNQAS